MNIDDGLLDEIEEFLQDYSDVVDGDYGIPAPNRAMQLLSGLTAAREGRTNALPH